MSSPLLKIDGLSVNFRSPYGVVRAVNDVSYDVHPGETVGVVGESGSGKSVTFLSMLGLLPQPPARLAGGRVEFEGRDLLQLSQKELRDLRGDEIAMIFQDPMSSLNPVLTVGFQLVEAIQCHEDISRETARQRSMDLLDIVGIPSPAARFRAYPHEYSGGMRQRAMIAMAMANRPKLLIADEPTTALDVTIQAQIVEVLERARSETGATTILITHDLGLIAEMADRVVVMYGGRVVETGRVEEIFHEPKHPYTLGLISSLPRIDAEVGRLLPIRGAPPSLSNIPSGCAFHPRCDLRAGRERCVRETPGLEVVGPDHTSACHFYDEMSAEVERVNAKMVKPVESLTQSSASRTTKSSAPSGSDDGEPVLYVDRLVKHFPSRSGWFRRSLDDIQAVDGISFEVMPGETLGLVGESGCGKSTTGRCSNRLEEPTAGTIRFQGRDLASLSSREVRDLRKDMQVVFQDAGDALNPRMKVRDIIAEPLRIHGQYKGKGGRRRVSELLDRVGLHPEHAARFPHEFSGGQRQRIGIARALALGPKLLILDEPVSALDVSIQAQVINLLVDLQRDLGLSYLFIAHDLSVVRHICDRVAVMYLGRIVEIGTRSDIFENPTHPYTQALLSAVPVTTPDARGLQERILLEGDVPSPVDPPSGCRFRTRCWKAEEICEQEDPPLVDQFGLGHPSACHFAEVRRVISPVGPRIGEPH